MWKSIVKKKSKTICPVGYYESADDLMVTHALVCLLFTDFNF